MNLRGLLDGVRIHTRNPRAQQPSDRTLLKLLSIQVQNFLTELNIYGQNWSVDETTLTITPNTAEYTLAADGFGKPIEVLAVNPADPAFHNRQVDFFELGDLNYDWDMPVNFGGAFAIDGSPHSTLRIAFFRRGGLVKARVLPVPAQAATFRILYQVGVFGETMPLDDSILLPEHHGLIEVRTALAALPHCEWFDAEDANKARRAELAASLTAQEAQLAKVFRANIANQTANTAPNYRELWNFDD